jgi:hypothetical protein
MLGERWRVVWKVIGDRVGRPSNNVKQCARRILWMLDSPSIMLRQTMFLFFFFFSLSHTLSLFSYASSCRGNSCRYLRSELMVDMPKQRNISQGKGDLAGWCGWETSTSLVGTCVVHVGLTEATDEEECNLNYDYEFYGALASIVSVVAITFLWPRNDAGLIDWTTITQVLPN